MYQRQISKQGMSGMCVCVCVCVCACVCVYRKVDRKVILLACDGIDKHMSDQSRLVTFDVK